MRPLRPTPLQGGRSILAPSLMLALVTALLSVLAWSVPGHAQEIPATELRVVDIDDSAFPTVRIVLEAENDGRPLPELAPADLVIRETGAPATVTFVQRATDASIPLALVVALDISGSVSGATLARSKEAAALLVQSLAEADSAALVSFADRAQVVQSLTTEKPLVVDAINRLQSSGNTALYDAVVLSAGSASPGAGTTRRAVVLLSDGEDFGGISTAGRDGSLQQAAESGAVFYVIGVGSQIDQPFLRELAARTGGKYYAAPGAGEIAGIYESLSELLRSQFVVEIESSADAAPRERNITISLVRDSVTTLSVDYASRQPLPTPTPPPVSPTPTSTPLPPTPTSTAMPVGGIEDSGGGGVAWTWLLVGGFATLAAGGGAAFALVRRRSPAAPAPLQPADTPAAPLPSSPPIVAALARLTLGDRELDISEEQGPFTAGSSEDCLLNLPRRAGIAPVHARFWWRDGRLMLHHVAPGFETRVNGDPVEWVSLASGDHVEIGECTINFERREPSASS